MRSGSRAFEGDFSVSGRGKQATPDSDLGQKSKTESSLVSRFSQDLLLAWLLFQRPPTPRDANDSRATPVVKGDGI